MDPRGPRQAVLRLRAYLPAAHALHRTDRADPAHRGRLPASFGENEVHEVQGGRLVLDDRERRYVRALYDGDVARADAVMGGILDTLRRDGVLDRTIVVVLSDHGEDLWDHDATRSPGHGHSLYQELVRVPLFVRAPHVIAAGRRIETPVSLLDIAPTLLELAGLPPDPAHQGRSLARTLRDGSEPSVEPVR